MPRTRFATLAERLEADLDKGEGENDCWFWLGFKNQGGYGMFTYRNQTLYAHKVAYILHKGEPPAGAYVLHKCDEPDCCNPQHLFLGNHKDNAMDMAQKRRAANQFNLSDEDVRAIRSSREPATKIAEQYGITYNVVYKIRRGDSWLHVV